MVIVGSRGAEHQMMRVFPPPNFDTTLQRSQQFIRVGIRLLTLEPLEQFSRSSPWFGVKPLTQLRRHRQERGEASSQSLAIDRHMTMTLLLSRRSTRRHGGGTSFDRGGIELSQDATDRRVSWSFPPLHAERFAQPGDVNIDEAVDCPIRVGAGDDCQDRNSTTCGRRYSFPSARLGSSISVSRSTNELKRCHGNPMCCVGCQRRSHMESRRRNPLRRYPTAVCISVLHFGTHPVQDESVEQP